MSSFYDLYHQSFVRGKDGKTHSMSLRRKSSLGVGQFSDVTKPMSTDKLAYVRQRSRKVRQEAQQREFILSNPFLMIREWIVKR